MVFGTRLRQLREEKKITQKELAKYLNISDRVVGYYETNNRFPKDENMLKKLADFFDVSIDYLIGCTDIQNPYKSTFHVIDVSKLPDEVIRHVEEYVEFLNNKYTHK
jgi:Predicted transcriptional regulators